MFRRVGLGLILSLFLPASIGTLLAQNVGSGTISGTINDPKGLGIPGAPVVVLNKDTGIERSINTNEVGLFTAPFLQPGAYEIRASKAGFAKVVRSGIVLQVGRTVTVDLELPIQATTETINVTGLASLIDPEKTDMSQIVSQTQKENLPIAGRRWENFALLTPNVTTDGGSGLTTYRGISGLYNQSSVDGTSNTQAFFSETKGRTTIPYVYSMDSIQEFAVSSSNYGAELGQAAGGVVNAATKSGSNTQHGDLFYYLRYPSLNALDPIQKSKGIYTQPVKQQQQFGGSTGGPVVKDKLFYFLTYDGSRKVNPIAYTSSSNFPLACTSAAISASQCSAANGYVVSQLGSRPRFQSQDIAFAKLDGQITSRNHVSTSFNFNNFRSPNSYRTNTTQNNESVSSNGNSAFHERTFVATLDSILTNSLINNVRFQWSRDLEMINNNSPAPNVGITNVMTYGMPNALPRPAFPDEHRVQISDSLSWNHGRHTFKMGADVSAIHELLINLFQGGGVYTYSGTAGFNNWVADVMGINLGDGLTGRHFTTFVQVTDPVTGVGKDDFYDTDFAGFVQDAWKVRPNLTLNLGLRYELQHIPQPEMPNTATPLTTLYTSTINIDKNNFAPRLGAAWAVRKGTVVRAGYGLFYAKTSNSTYYATRVENGVIQQTFNCNPTTCPSLTFPNVIFTPPGGTPIAPFEGALVPNVTSFSPPSATQTTRGQNPDWVNPQVHEGELVVEHELPAGMSVSAGYVFSRGMRLPMFIDTNIAPATTTRSYDVTDSTGATQETHTFPFYTKRIDATGPILTGFSDVNSWYHSLVITVHKRMRNSLEFVANYTLSKAEDGGQVPGVFGTFNGTDSPIDPYNRRLEYALSDLDQRHRFVASVVWMPQFGKSMSNKAAKQLASGWVFSSIVTGASGQPLTPVLNGSASGGPAGGLTGGVVNNSGTALSSSRVPFLDRNSYDGPGLKNVDFRISREFAIRERMRFLFSGEAFNLFNFSNLVPTTNSATAVNGTRYNVSAAGSGVCSGHTNMCLVPNAAFFAPLNSTNGLYGARQLQISGRFDF